MAKSTTSGRIRYRNYAEVMARVGDVPCERLLIHPEAGTAIPEDLLNPDITLGRPVEMVGGILVEKPVGSAILHPGRRLVSVLYAYLQRNNIGIVSGSQRILPKGSKSCRLPDVTFLRFDSMADISKYDADLVFLEDTPDLVADICSPGNTVKEMELKRSEYEAAGVPLVWYVDPDAKTVTVYPKGKVRGSKVLAEGDALDGGKVLPGFALPVADLFASRVPAVKPKKKRK